MTEYIRLNAVNTGNAPRTLQFTLLPYFLYGQGQNAETENIGKLKISAGAFFLAYDETEENEETEEF